MLKVGSDRALALVHRRLAIIDLSASASQPMRDTETGNLLVYNGEIYNFRVLRDELASEGVRWQSHSDTEVLLKGYRLWRDRVLEKLCGMFAFALWDAVNGELLLAVDPVGIKPLYYWTGPDHEFLFASEVRTLLASGMVARRIDPVALEGYLSYGAVQGPNTIIEGVRALPAGSYLRVSGQGRLSGPRVYWRPPFPSAPSGEHAALPTGFEDELRSTLAEVVAEHLISDVPLGVFLSGGIDSSAIVAISSQRDSEIRTFSVTFAEEKFSEAPYSREIARLHRTKHSELCLGESELHALLPGALKALDQPTMDGINVYVIAQAVRQAGLKVALSGQGADEIFGGYNTSRRVPRAVAWRGLRIVPSRAWSALAMLWIAIQRRRRVLPDKLGQLLESELTPFSTYFLLRQNFDPVTRRELFPTGAATNPEGLPSQLAEELRRMSADLDPINQVSFLELRTYLINMLLRDGDVMSMAHGLEVRVPFLDRRVVELVARVPGVAKLDRRLPKPLLLRAVGEGIPPHVYRRPKQGFVLPWPQWLRGRLRPMAEAALNDATTFRDVGVEPAVVARLWRAFLQGRNGITWHRVWSLLVLREWAYRHLTGETPQALGGTVLRSDPARQPSGAVSQ